MQRWHLAPRACGPTARPDLVTLFLCALVGLLARPALSLVSASSSLVARKPVPILHSRCSSRRPRPHLLTSTSARQINGQLLVERHRPRREPRSHGCVSRLSRIVSTQSLYSADARLPPGSERGELYTAFVPDLTAERRKASQACAAYNRDALDVTRRKQVELLRKCVSLSLSRLSLSRAHSSQPEPCCAGAS